MRVWGWRMNGICPVLSSGKKAMAVSRLEKMGGKWAAPLRIPFYGEGAEAVSLRINGNALLQAHYCGCSVHVPHVLHLTRIVGGRGK